MGHEPEPGARAVAPLLAEGETSGASDVHPVPGAGDRVEARGEDHQVEVVVLGGRLDARAREALDRRFREVDEMHVVAVVGLVVVRLEG